LEPIDELGRELRDRVGAEFREEAEAGEGMAAIAAARGRTFAEVAGHLAQRGARVRVEIADKRFYGAVLAGGVDVIVVGMDGGTVIVNLAGCDLVTLHGPGDDTGMPRRGPGSLKAALYELEGVEDIELGLRSGVALQGMIRVVGHDHVMFRDDHERVIPITSVAWLIRRAD